MGFGIGLNGVDVSVRVDQTLADFSVEVGSLVGRLVALGCRRIALDVHENGAVVSGDRPVEPVPVSDETWRSTVKEIVRAAR